MGQKIYLDYDREALDAQLNLRARWPEHPEIFARWAEDSARANDEIDPLLDLAYGDSPGQTLDLFLPGSAAPPLLAFIHGGYWQSLDKGDFGYLAPPFVAQGIAYASLNYDLAPAVTIDEIVEQVRRALVWLRDNAGQYGIDPDRIYISGHSAGGHLAAMAISTDWVARSDLGTRLPADLVKGGCSVSGVYDLEPLRLSYHQEILSIGPDCARDMSPINCVPAESGPMILAVGAEETEEFRRQQAIYKSAWEAAGPPLVEVPLPGRNHFTAIDALGERGHPLFQSVLGMVS